MMHPWHPSSTGITPENERLASLTQKQRDVLDLLVEFKTSKEISRILDISPHTVDQRVEAAKTKLGAGSRSELARVYRELVGAPALSEPPRADPAIYERLTYEHSPVAEWFETPQSPSRVGPALAPPSDPEPGNSVVPDNTEDDEVRVVPQLFDGRWGTLARLLTILAITVLLCVAFLGGLTIFVQMSNLFLG
jgi:DNA-binding CsgD family transcriptional regulator